MKRFEFELRDAFWLMTIICVALAAYHYGQVDAIRNCTRDIKTVVDFVESENLRKKTPPPPPPPPSNAYYSDGSFRKFYQEQFFYSKLPTLVPLTRDYELSDEEKDTFLSGLLEFRDEVRKTVDAENAKRWEQHYTSPTTLPRYDSSSGLYLPYLPLEAPPPKN